MEETEKTEAMKETEETEEMEETEEKNWVVLSPQSEIVWFNPGRSRAVTGPMMSGPQPSKLTLNKWLLRICFMFFILILPLIWLKLFFVLFVVFGFKLCILFKDFLGSYILFYLFVVFSKMYFIWCLSFSKCWIWSFWLDFYCFLFFYWFVLCVTLNKGCFQRCYMDTCIIIIIIVITVLLKD